MANSRDKGASFERKICSLIKHALGYDARRNLDQYQVGGADIEIPGWSIECKAYQRSGSNSYKTSWWEQCVANCGDKEPVFSTNQDLVCEVDIDTWFYIVREKI